MFNKSSVFGKGNRSTEDQDCYGKFKVERCSFSSLFGFVSLINMSSVLWLVAFGDIWDLDRWRESGRTFRKYFSGQKKKGRLCQQEWSVNEHGIARAHVRRGGGCEGGYWEVWNRRPCLGIGKVRHELIKSGFSFFHISSIHPNPATSLSTAPSFLSTASALSSIQDLLMSPLGHLQQLQIPILTMYISPASSLERESFLRKWNIVYRDCARNDSLLSLFFWARCKL